MMKGTVTGPVVTPPESKAAGMKDEGAKAARMEAAFSAPVSGRHRDQVSETVGDIDLVIRENLSGHQNVDRVQEDHQEDADTHCHGEDERHIGDGGDLFRKHGEIRLRNGDEHSENEAQDQRDPELFGLAHLNADPFAEGRHGHAGAQREQCHPKNQHDRPEEEQDQNAGVQRRDRDAQHQDNGEDRDHAADRFQKFFFQLFQNHLLLHYNG